MDAPHRAGHVRDRELRLVSFLVASLSLLLPLTPACYRSHDLARTDAGPLPDGRPRRDIGAPTDSSAPLRCDEESLAPYSGPPCSDAVNACRRGCGPMDEPCRDACLDMPCRVCVYGTIFHCANQAGCEPLWRELACCVEDVPMCSHLRGFERAFCADRCPMRFEPYAMCIEERGGMECFRRAARDCELR